MSCRVRRFLMSGLAVVAVTIGSIALAADILTQFHLTEEDAQQGVLDSLWVGVPAGVGGAPSIFRTLSPQARAGAVTAAAAFVRAYCESDAFRQSYAAKRQAERPVDVPATAAAPDVGKQMAAAEKAIADSKAAMANLPPEMRKMMEDAMKQAGGTDVDSQLAQAEKDVKAEGRKAKSAQVQADKDIAARRLSVKEFDEKYPANPEKFIAGRLREFLALTETVPVEAALVRRSGTMVFVDPALEGKPVAWKQLYRAGKPSVDAARDAATAWLATLPR